MRLSFVVMAFNQEKYIRDVVACALAQEYPDLEIILTDDCSADSTFDIMQDMANSYDGPHRLVLNRNPENLGLIGHVNRLFDLATGDYVIYNAGDDCSEPCRARVLADIIQAEAPHYIHSNVLDLHPDGRPFGKLRSREHRIELSDMPIKELARKMSHGIGASACWHRELMSKFGPITELGLFEDRVMLFRARLIGKVSYTDQRLIRMRRGIGLSSRNNEPIKSLGIDIATLRQRQKDVLHIFPDDNSISRVIQKKLDACLQERQDLVDKSMGA